MRGPISDVDLPFATAFPLRSILPGLLLDDPLLMDVCAALDDLLAPVVAALDCFPAYLDPRLAPDDFLAWLASLVGSEATRDAIVSAAGDQAARGTAAGLRRRAAAAAGVDVERVTVVDPGGVTWSPVAGGSRRPVGPAPVRVVVAADHPVDESVLRLALAADRPVHCRLEIEVIAS